LRNTPNGQNGCGFSLALNRSYKGADGEWKDATDYVDVVAWGPLGERVEQYLKRGSPCLVNGRLQSRQWEQDGQKRTKIEVVAQDVTFLRGDDNARTETAERPAPAPTQSAARPAAATPAAATPDTVIEDIGDEPINLDDIPF
jgi:single-strand DNA-binding protein